MRRGDIVLVAAPGDYGKPRPAIIIQTDVLTELGAMSVAVCLMTSAPTQAPLFRIDVDATPESGLDQPSQIMVEKLFTVRKEKVKAVIGRLTDEQIVRLNRTLAFVIGLG